MRIASLIALLMVITSPAWALDLDKLVDALRHAEGNANYGLVSVPKWYIEDGGARYYAKEVLRVQEARCKGHEDVIGCISNQYAPIGVKNDPNNLNRHHARNLKHWYYKGDKS